MVVTAKSFGKYRQLLAAISQQAATDLTNYLQGTNYIITSSFIDFAFAVASKYGLAAGALACLFYDELARYWGQTSGIVLPPAQMAALPTYDGVKIAAFGSAKSSPLEIPGAVARLTKLVAEDTTLNNAKRDGAQFAWIPAGDTCAFCCVLASRGWGKVSKRTMKNGHAEHVHSNCDCTYGVRFDNTTVYEGYDPQVYLDMYENAEGRTPKEKVNSMRREFYAEHKRESYGGLESSAAEETFVQ